MHNTSLTLEQLLVIKLHLLKLVTLLQMVLLDKHCLLLLSMMISLKHLLMITILGYVDSAY